MKRIMIAAAGSGSGKTLLACGLLQALKRRNFILRSYKCGPDYIDPMFHKQVLGIPGGNLDSYFSGEEEIRKRLVKEAAGTDFAVIEGVMGYYDGLGGNTTKASSYDIARITETPVILLVNGRGMGLSIAAVVKGFREFRPDSRIAGVIVNRTNPAMAERLRECVEEQGVSFLGCLPERKEWNWESRHLGLMMPEEISHIRETIDSLADGMEQYLNIDRIIEIAGEAEEIYGENRKEISEDRKGIRGENFGEIQPERCVRIAVARDEAFCFYYQENLSMLEEMGAELLFFSPLHDEKLPEGIDGLLLGGGYPELYAKELSEGISMKKSIKEAAELGLPISAECGGFLYLLDSLEAEDGKFYPMAEVLSGRGEKRGRLVRFGYIGLTVQQNTAFLKKGETIRGHEFHYWDSTENGDAFFAEKPSKTAGWNCMRAEKNIVAGFPHLYYPSSPSYAAGLIEACQVYREKRARDEQEISLKGRENT